MNKKVFSKCGMRCDLCLIYRPNVEKEDRRMDICNAWKKYGMALSLTLIRLYAMVVLVKEKMQYYLALHVILENV